MQNQIMKEDCLTSNERLQKLVLKIRFWCFRNIKTKFRMRFRFFRAMQLGIQYEDDLYTFDASDLEKFIKTINNNIRNVLIFGHNGAITDFVNKFGDVYVDNVPTSGLVSINFEINNWKDIQKGKTITTLFPKELK
jgi:phosphohistidine phosphatase SixA